jgi:opacity protein-like surface antigen
MKRTVLVCAAVLLVAASVPKPAAAGVTVDFGIKGGLNITTLAYSGSVEWWDNLGYTNGPIFGVFFSLGRGPVTIQPEVFYSRRGSKLEINASDHIVYRSEFLEVPVLVKWNVISGPISPVVFAGPFGAFSFSYKEIKTIGGTTLTTDISEGHSKSDYGLIFGGGLEYKLKSIKLILEGRYTMGMRNIEYQSETDSFKNSGFSVLFGVGF